MSSVGPSYYYYQIVFYKCFLMFQLMIRFVKEFVGIGPIAMFL